MLSIEFIPYSEIESLTSVGRIRKLLKLAKEKKIVLLQGRLKKDEETELIKTTMEEINKDFKGIELAVVYPEKKNVDFLNKAKNAFFNAIMGDRLGFTVIGPATVVKEIKRDPNKIQLMTGNNKRRRKK
tara:strand:+ start:188 stop:574 length:387 start_codon:yes stop_codon:yes gene_type:complete